MSKPARAPQAPSTSNFVRQASKPTWPRRLSSVRTRFPPEPNGYLHFGHVKSICLNFGIAAEYGGSCNLRFDDTNPEKEEQEYVDSIKEGVKWLGFDWGEKDLRLRLLRQALRVRRGADRQDLAYVDSQTAEQMAAARGTFTEPGKESPWRNRSVEENLKLFREMRDGKYRDGEHVLRAKIDMRSPNLNMRDPRCTASGTRPTTHRTGGASTRLTTGRTGCPTASSASRTRCARSSSRTIGRLRLVQPAGRRGRADPASIVQADRMHA